jgi:uncharacterized membrane protein YtjA (UPF0391 family)
MENEAFRSGTQGPQGALDSYKWRARCLPYSGRRQLGVKEHDMLGWCLAFFVFALVAGYLGFFGIAGAASSIAQVLFFIFLAMLVISFFARAIRGDSVT